MENGEQRSDAELLVAARSCSEPFGVFYERHFAAVLAFFRRRVRGAEEAFDLTAETFAAALVSLPRFQPGPEPPRAWLFAIARNKLHEAVRSRRIQDEARRALAMQPIELDRGAIEAIEAHHLEERAYAEIAAELQCSESVVRKRVSRGLAALRSQLPQEAP
jgi:DNA-directed RNA polymerase specialized sigma24 family protein